MSKISDSRVIANIKVRSGGRPRVNPYMVAPMGCPQTFLYLPNITQKSRDPVIFSIEM